MTNHKPIIITLVTTVFCFISCLNVFTQEQNHKDFEMSFNLSLLPPGFGLAFEHPISENYTIKSEAEFNWLLLMGSQFSNRELSFYLFSKNPENHKKKFGYYVKLKDSWYGHREKSGFEVVTYQNEIYFIGGGICFNKKRHINENWFIGKTLSLGANIPLSSYAHYYPFGSDVKRSLYIEPSLSFKIYIGFNY